jgi:hypothetical protein
VRSRSSSGGAAAPAAAQNTGPLAPRRGLVVAHVDGAGGPLERLHRRLRRVVGVNEARDVTVGDHAAGARPAGREPRAGSVQQAVAQHDPLGQLAGGGLERRDAVHGRATRLGGVEVQRDLLAGRLVAGLVGEGHALGDDPAHARAAGRVDEVARSVDPQPRVGSQIELAQVGQLVYHHVAADDREQRLAIECVGDDRLGTERAQQRGALRPPRHRGHGVTAVDQQRHQPAADDAGRAGEEDAHCPEATARGG